MEVIYSSAHLRADTSTKFMKNLEEKKIELLNELLFITYTLLISMNCTKFMKRKKKVKQFMKHH